MVVRARRGLATAPGRRSFPHPKNAKTRISAGFAKLGAQERTRTSTVLPAST